MFQQPRRPLLDELNRFLLIAGLIGSVLAMFFAQLKAVRYAFSGVSSVLLILAVLRIFSKNTARRYQENLKYLTAETAVRDFFRKLFRPGAKGTSAAGGAKPHRAHKARKNPTWSEIRQYKYLICPQCTQRLRVPRGKGRLRVTCTRCGNVFEAKS